MDVFVEAVFTVFISVVCTGTLQNSCTCLPSCSTNFLMQISKTNSDLPLLGGYIQSCQSLEFSPKTFT